MKKKLSLLTFFMFSFVLSASSVMCFVTGFDIPVRPMIIIAATAVSSLLFTLISTLKHPVLLTFAAFVPYIIGAVLARRQLVSGLFCVIGALFEHLPVIGLNIAPDVSDATGFMLLIAAIISAVVSVCTSKRSFLLLTLASVLAPVVPCIVIPGSRPGTLPFTVLTAALILLVMTEYHSAENVGKAALTASIPVIILVFIIYLAAPPASFTPPPFADKVRQKVLSAVDGLLFPAAEGSDSIHILDDSGLYISETMELSTAGPRTLSDTPVMAVYSTQTGQTYLRGMSYGDYANNSWLPAPSEEYAKLELGFEPLTEASGVEGDYVTVQQYRDSNCIYTPYYLSKLPPVGQTVADAYIANSDSHRSYTATFSAQPAYDNDADSKKIYEDYVYQHYLSVPEEIRDYAMENIWDGFFDSMTIAQKCTAVTDHLASAAVYDLDTPFAPEESDFVLWFLQHEKRGYCVHFASAATLMLRAIGIPARYVTGFCCNTVTDQWRNVSEKNAHAWVEYYVNGCGWLPLEATPPAFIEQTATEALEAPPDEEENGEDEYYYSASDIPSFITVSEADISLPEPDEEAIPAEKEKVRIPPAVTIAVCLFLLAAAVVIRRTVIFALRNRAMTTGTANSRALGMWKYITALSRACGIENDKKCESIALKARFSQHIISDEELAQLSSVIDELKNELQQENLFYRVIYRFVLAVL